MKKIALIAVVVIAVVLSGCFLQPEIEGTGTISLNLGGSSFGSASLFEEVKEDAVGAIKIYILRGGNYYNFETGAFQPNPYAKELDVTTGSVNYVIEGLPPSTRYEVFAAVGKSVTIDENDEKKFLQTYKYASSGPVTVSVGSVTTVDLNNRDRVSGLEYSSLTRRIAGLVATDDTVYAATTDTNGSSRLYDLANPSVPVAEFDVQIASLGTGRIVEKGVEKEVVLINTNMSDGIFVHYIGEGDDGNNVSIGALPERARGDVTVRITRSEAHVVKDNDDEIQGTIIFYQSETGFAGLFFEEDMYLSEIRYEEDYDWKDPIEEQDLRQDLEDLNIDVNRLIVDFAFNRDEEYGVAATAVGTYFVNRATLDAVIDDDEYKPGYYLDFDEENNEVLIYRGDPVADQTVRVVEVIRTPAEYIDELQRIILPESTNRVRAVALTGNYVILGTRSGLYSIGFDGNKNLSGVSQGVATATRMTGSLDRRVEKLSSNADRTKVAALYGNGTIEIISLEAGTPRIQVDRRLPFYAGLPYVPAFNSSLARYETDRRGQRIGLALAEATGNNLELYVSGSYGVARRPALAP